MKKRLLAAVCLAGLPLICWSQTAPAVPTNPPAVPAPTAVTERALLNQYCVVCHNEKAKKAGQPSGLAITLDNLDVAHVEQNPQEWERVIHKVRAGMMPPAGM